MIYSHPEPASLESKLIQFLMNFAGMKKRMEKKVYNNKYSKEPAPIPKSILKRYSVTIDTYKGRKVWTVCKAHAHPEQLILFLHGGAYYANISSLHWDFIEQLMHRVDAKMVIPDYPLAPEASCVEAYQFLDGLYAEVLKGWGSEQIVFMGDSAGGGLALGFAQKIANEGIRQPAQLILFSPWLDVSMSNPEIPHIAGLDCILSVDALKEAGSKYAGALDLRDFRVSPLHGEFHTLGKISVFAGGRDVLMADARALKQKLESLQIDFNYFEYPQMFHDWVLVKHLKESNDALEKTARLLNARNL